MLLLSHVVITASFPSLHNHVFWLKLIIVLFCYGCDMLACFVFYLLLIQDLFSLMKNLLFICSHVLNSLFLFFVRKLSRILCVSSDLYWLVAKLCLETICSRISLFQCYCLEDWVHSDSLNFSLIFSFPSFSGEDCKLFSLLTAS